MEALEVLVLIGLVFCLVIIFIEFYYHEPEDPEDFFCITNDRREKDDPDCEHKRRDSDIESL